MTKRALREAALASEYEFAVRGCIGDRRRPKPEGGGEYLTRVVVIEAEGGRIE